MPLRVTGEGAKLPGLADLAVPQLTVRVREIARLAARGLSSRAIAEQLVVSIRTVENDVAAVFGKLGVTSRQELDPGLDQGG